MSTAIVIVGGGFGGLEAAFTLKSLTGDAITITLVDRDGFHSFIPSIHEVSSGKITSRSIQIPLETMLSPAGVQFVRDAVIAIDPANRRLTTAAQALDYDYLVLATGAENHFFGVPGAEEYSFRFRTPDDAERIHANLVRLLEEEQKDLHLVLAGGGTEGVEVAGELLDLIRDSGREFGPDGGSVAITLVEAQQQLLPGFPPEARAFAEKYLREQGVTIITGQRITAVQKGSIVLTAGRELPQSMLIWTGGIKPSRLIDGLPLPKDPVGWLLVNDRLHSPADDRLYAVGDCVAVQGPNGPLPLQRLAYHAQDQGALAGINISRDLRGRALMRYAPKYKPQLVSIGRGMGIYTQGDVFKAGAWVDALKKAVERKHLMSYLTRPLLSSISRKVPGIDLFKRLGLKLPF
ncbi:MAG: FAD-dependent oxidoreductase [Nitrospirae bacterium]|nr:FAD-dependent oxidoreductase [Nitrospirota bacterium]